MKKISVLLATYNPNEKYLVELIQSLNDQDYDNFDILIRDDHSDAKYQANIEKIAAKYLTKVKYSITYNQENMGSNKTFEELTKLAQGDFIAYCDQDDIWKSDKLSRLVEQMQTDNVLVAYSDMEVINGEDTILNKSYKNYIKGLVHPSGECLYHFFLRKNSITGCSMIIRTKTAKLALPFPDSSIYVHDHWLLLFASCLGEIAYVQSPLISYRVHANNQIGAKNPDRITNKDEYISRKISKELQRLNYVFKRELNLINIDVQKYLDSSRKSTNIRNLYLKKPLSIYFIHMLRLIRQRPSLIIFELLLGLCSNKCSRHLIKLTQK